MKPFLINKFREIFKNNNIILAGNNISYLDEIDFYEDIEKIYKEKILTCIFCGLVYPQGTKTHGEKILTDHIKVCEKHPMRKLEEENKLLKIALSELVGVSTKVELKDMKIQISEPILPISNSNKATMINAIDLLLKLINEEKEENPININFVKVDKPMFTLSSEFYDKNNDEKIECLEMIQKFIDDRFEEIHQDGENK